MAGADNKFGKGAGKTENSRRQGPEEKPESSLRTRALNRQTREQIFGLDLWNGEQDRTPVPSSRHLPEPFAVGKSIDAYEKLLMQESLQRDYDPDYEEMVEAVYSFKKTCGIFRGVMGSPVREEVMFFLFEEIDPEDISIGTLYDRFRAKGLREAFLERDDFVKFVVEVVRLKKFLASRDLVVFEMWKAFWGVLRDDNNK